MDQFEELITNSSFDDLVALKQRVENQIKKLQANEVAEARKQIQSIANKLGISVEDIMAGRNYPKNFPAKYRHPDDHTKTWAGRGKKPHWLVDELAKGAKLEDYLLPANKDNQ